MKIANKSKKLDIDKSKSGFNQEDYDYAINFRREYYKKVLDIAKHWNVHLIQEDELPAHRKNVMRCEDNNTAFLDMKRKRCFFSDIDTDKDGMRERLRAIK